MPASATAKAAEFGAQALLSAQMASVRGAENAKALAAFEQLSPEIERLRSEGYGVTVTVVVEMPSKVDIAARWADVGDPSQVVYFKKMYISQVLRAGEQPAVPQVTVRENLAPGDPDQQDPHEWTLQQQLEGQLGEKYPVPGTGPRVGSYFLSRDLQLPAFGASAQPARRGQGAQSAPIHGIAGTYRPKFEALFIGHASVIARMMPRRLEVKLMGGKPVPAMWYGSEAYGYKPDVAHSPMVMSGLFYRGEGLPPAAEWIRSGMEYPRDGLILEWVKGLDSNQKVQWDALWSWHRT